MRGANPALRSPLASLVTLVGIAFLVAPIVVVALFSLNKSSTLTLPFHGFSLRWYRKVLSDPEFADALISSLRIGALVVAACLVFGTALAIGIVRNVPRVRGVVTAVIFAPLAIPLLFVGLSLFTYLGRLSIPFGIVAILIGHLIFVLPYYTLLLVAALDRLDPVLDEVAADLGAGALKRFTRVTLPQVWPLILAAAALAFALSFDEFPITYWVNGTETTLPLHIYALLRTSIDPSVNAVSMLLTLMMLFLFSLAFLLVAPFQRRNEIPHAASEGEVP